MFKQSSFDLAGWTWGSLRELAPMQPTPYDCGVFASVLLVSARRLWGHRGYAGESKLAGSTKLLTPSMVVRRITGAIGHAQSQAASGVRLGGGRLGCTASGDGAGAASREDHQLAWLKQGMEG